MPPRQRTGRKRWTEYFLSKTGYSSQSCCTNEWMTHDEYADYIFWTPQMTNCWDCLSKHVRLSKLYFQKVPQLLEFYNLHFWACWHFCPVLHKVALHILLNKLLPTTKEKTSRRTPVVLIIIHKWNQQMFDSFCIRFVYLLQCGLKKTAMCAVLYALGSIGHIFQA